MSLRSFSCFLVFAWVVAAWLTPGQTEDASEPRPSNLTDTYFIQGNGENPYTWSCRRDAKLLYGRMNEQTWRVRSLRAEDDSQCLKYLVYGSTLMSAFDTSSTIISKDTGEVDSYFAYLLSYKIPLLKLHSKKVVDSKVLDTVDFGQTFSTWARNYDEKQTQEALTMGHSESTTITHETSIEFTTSVTARAKLGIPLIGETEFEVSVGYGRTTTTSESKTVTRDAPPQKIVLAPRTEAKVGYRFFKTQMRVDYVLDFVVDESHAFKQLKDQVKRKAVNVKLERGPSSPTLRLVDDKWIMTGFRLTEHFWKYESEVVFGKPQPLSDGEGAYPFGWSAINNNSTTGSPPPPPGIVFEDF